MKSLSIIDTDLQVDGNLEVKGRLLIRGVVHGTIKGAQIVIAKEGKVFCDVTVDEMTIGGFFEGELRASGRVTILATGRCAGTVHCRDFIVESGGILEAEVLSSRNAEKGSGREREGIPMIAAGAVKHFEGGEGREV